MEQETVTGYRLSPEQKHLWLLQHADHPLPYRAQGAVLINGPLNTSLLKTAVAQVITRHEILRTTFACLPDMLLPLQVITEGSVLWGAEEDWQQGEAEEQRARLDALFHGGSSVAFDFTQGPLVHLSLATLAADKHVLVVNLPALCADTTTLKNLVRDLSRAYAACLSGEQLLDEPPQYADLAAWQNELLESEDTRTGREYWRKQDLSVLRTLKLPFETPQTEQARFTPQSVSVSLPSDICTQFSARTQHLATTLPAWLLACWQVLLGRLSGQEDLLIGLACEGRRYADLAGAMGPLTRYVPLCSQLAQDLPFQTLVLQTQAAIDEARKRQEYFSWEHQNGGAGDGDIPLFCPISFEVEEIPVQHTAGPLTFTLHKHAVCSDRFKLKLVGVQQGEELTIELHYDAQAFHARDIERLADSLQQVLMSTLRNPEQVMRQVEILGVAERRKLLVEFNRTQANFSEALCIHQVFETQVERAPHSPAVVYDGQILTYAELNTRANRLAHYLQAMGVGPDVPVALCLERSLEMVVGLLGILKAGGAYVPLDPVLPKERLAFMLAESQAKVIVTQRRLSEDLPQNGIRVVCLDTEEESIARERDKNPCSGVTAANVSYVLFTSGSTGRPKGVAVEHRAVLNYLYGIVERLALPAGASFALVSTFATDLGHTVLFPALCTGGCLHVFPAEQVADPVFMTEYVNHHTIDCLKITPSHLTALLTASTQAAQLLPRQRLILGGEVCRWELVERLKELAPECQIFNHYGPTETTVGVTTHRVEATSFTHQAATVPLGRPLANTQIYILDSHLQPVPTWVTGEIYVGGAGLARGYLNHPELTAEKFIPHPFSTDPGARLYKTGDLARYLPDGTIEFFGRADAQVKIRGFRIELGEIEAALSQHPAVRMAVVLAREEGEGDKQLVAYVVPQPEQDLPSPKLRSFLQARLPDYMVPAAFVLLETLPLTPNGKVDRRALPAPDRIRSTQGGEYVAPRTPTEEVVAGIWADVLKLAQVGSQDNFFALGGHSLLATQVISRVRKTFQVEVPLRGLFEAPTVAGLAESIETAMRAEQGLQAQPILPVPRDRDLPLSFAQQRLWFLDQLEPGSAAYNLPAAVRLTGPLNVAALAQGLNEIVRRHEVLRTTFAVVERRPVQVITPGLTLALPVVDLSALPEAEWEVEGQRRAREEAQRPFDLAQGPLLRATLLRLEEEEHVGLFNLHHIISDAWSTGVLVRELAVLYEAYSRGQPSPLPELPIQYADFAVWQRRQLQGEVLEAQLAYWKQHLGNAPAILELPTDRPRPAVQTYRGTHHSFVLPAELSEGLKALSRREGVTLFMTLLAAFQTLLHRYTGQEDVSVGTPITNRNRVETEGLIGFFLNTLVMRTDMSGDPSFRELLGRVREVALEAYAHQDLPFENLVEELQPARDLSRTPLFQVTFVLQHAVENELKSPRLTFSPLEVESGTAKFDLTLFLWEGAERLAGTLEYNTDLFDAATMARMAGHFQTLLEGIVAQPDQRISTLPLLTPAEQHHVLVECNNTKTDYPQHVCIHQLFEAQVEQSPDTIAVVYENEPLTYRELNRRANQLAHYLRRLGVGPEVLVGICMERSLEMVVGLLGILKAGGAYVPLDPTYPLERLAFMVEDAGVKVLLTQERVVERLPMHQAQGVCLDSGWGAIAQGSVENLVSRTTPENLAYVIYTSGSTGRPKGTSVIHQSVVRLVKGTNYADLTAKEVFLQFAPISFDASTFEVWGSLLNGGRLVVFPSQTPSVKELGEVLQREHVTTLWLTAGLFHLMVDECLEDFRHVRQLLAGGDVLSVPHVLRVLEELKECKLINGYGPTENTTFTCCYPMTNASPIGNSIPIGRPIANTQIYILDSYLHPVPIGVPGELHIGGVGLARGYLNRPDLTAEKFIPHPFSAEPGARLYKTGDLARYLPDGTIEFLGRLDQQVKIRGFRIELGEIEVVLRQHPGVREVVVTAHEDAGGEKRLVAYVVPKQEQALTSSDLWSFLKQKLPDYMVPAAFVLLDTLPLTPNGKVDRRALPVPDQVRPELKGGFVAPRTPTEELLTGIWAEVLKLEQVGVHDNFFELGGHSLLATQVISRVRTTFQVELPLRRLFEVPTVAGLAASVEGALKAAHKLQVSPIARVARDRELPLSFAQQQLWFFDQLFPANSIYNGPFFARLKAPLNVRVLEQALGEIVRRHEVLRTTFTTVQGRPVQVIAPTWIVTLPMVDLSERPESEREAEALRLAKEEVQRPFDLTTGPLLRVTVARLGNGDHAVFGTIHHIVYDGWSLGILIRELAVLYQTFSAGRPSPLPELPIQYADFAVWQRQWLQGEALEAQLIYWKQQLGGHLPVLELPTDRPRPAMQKFHGATQSFVLSQTLTESLKALSRREGATLFMTLLAALKTLLYRYTRQTDILVAAPTAGRTRAETEELVGFFLNILILRTDLSGNPTFRELLGRVREMCLGAYAHQDLPIEKLVEVLRPGRNLSFASLVQVAFAFQNIPARVPRSAGGLPDLTLIPLQVEGGITDVDLFLSMGEEAGRLTGRLYYATDLFDTPTIARMLEHFQTLLEAIVADPAQRLLALPCLDEAERRQLLTKRYKLRRRDSLDRLDDIEELSNLTKHQLAIWVGQKLRPDVPLYHLASTLTIYGEVDRECFQKAFQILVNSSDALRTVIEERDGMPQQRVLASLPYAMEYVDFSHAAEPDVQLQAWARQRCQVPFAFEQCLFDSVLIKLSNKKFTWYLNQHHLITDGWSIWLIFNLMAELYERALRGQLAEKVELPPFQNYIAAERAYRGSSRYFKAEAYWKEKLVETREPIAFYGKTPLKQTAHVQRISYHLGVERTRRLYALASQEDIAAETVHASLFNIFAALLCTYLYRLSGNRRIAFGAPFHNRRSKVSKETIGLFVQMLPLCVTIDEHDTFLSLIKKIKAEMFAALRHGQYTVRNSLPNKAYEVVLNYHNMANASQRQYNGAPVQPEVIHTGYDNDSFGLRIVDFGGTQNFTLDFDFHCDVFAEEQRSWAIQHFLQVLDAFFADPTQPVRRVNLLSIEEKRRIVVEFNQTEEAFPQDHTIAQLFEAQAQNTPEQVAVVCEDQALTYAQLNAKANQLAHYLRTLGVGPEVLVGICMERSLEMVVGLLGILKAGGAYVPLDPAYPKERLAFMVEDTQTPVLLTQQRLVEALPTHRAHVLCLDADWVAIAQESTETPAVDMTADNLAYVIYTSGSTGKPKGVLVTHQNLVHSISARTIYYRDPVTSFLLLSSFAFDSSVAGIFWTLGQGGALYLAPQRFEQDLSTLPAVIATHRISHLLSLPSLYGLILAQAPPQSLASLRTVIVAGEPCPGSLAKNHYQQLPHVSLFNEYGPTEGTVWSSVYHVRSATEAAQVPIGQPIANTKIYLLDDRLYPVPIGVPGELYIGGHGVASGYLNRPELTAEHFIPNPFSNEPGARLYKTGDLARYLPDGTIEFLGRLDQQIKIRGFRIELGEIEVVLSQHPAVREAVVLAREDGPDDKWLVAYVVPKPEQALTSSDLWSFLKQKLPDYIVPATFVLLDTLPLTPNGKVDRRALPVPDRTRPEQDKAFVAPRDALELQLTQIWEDVLNIRPIGARDNFFELGGHSLLAVRLFSVIEKRLGQKLPLAALFQEATVEHLASLLRQPVKQAPPSSLVAIQPGGPKRPLFLVHPVEGSVFCYMDLTYHLGPNQPFYGLQARGLEAGQTPHTRIEDMAAHYINALHTIQPEGPYLLGGWSLGGIVAFEMAQQLLAQGQGVALLALLDARIPTSTMKLTREDYRAHFADFARQLGLALDSWKLFSQPLTDALLNQLLEKAKKAGLVPPNLEMSQMHDLLRVFEANMQALRNYVPHPYVGRAVLFKAGETPTKTPRDPMLGWGELITKGVEMHVVPGTHYTLLRKPHVQILAERLRACLQEAEKNEVGDEFSADIP